MASAKFEPGWWGRVHSGVKPCWKVWNFNRWPGAEVPFFSFFSFFFDFVT